MTDVPAVEAPASRWDLRGFVVGVTADRRGDEQAVMLRRLGVDVLSGPAMQTLAPPDEGSAVRAHLEAIIACPPDYLVANTGIGVRNLFALAAGWGLDQDLRQALTGVRIAARGPKAAGALRLAGLQVWWRASSEQLVEVRDHLIELGVEGARIVFQLHGDDRQGFSAALRAAGAEVTDVEVYQWSLPTDSDAVVALVEACCAGTVDAMTFTAAPAVRNLLDVADASGRAGALLDALNREMVVGCVGPVCAAAAHEEGVAAPVIPEHWRLGSLVKRVGTALADRRRHLEMVGTDGPVDVVVQGSLLIVDGAEVALDRHERGVARILTEVPGAAVTVADLLERVWRGEGGGDRAAVDATVAALQAKLAAVGGGLCPVDGGAYRWVAEEVGAAGRGVAR